MVVFLCFVIMHGELPSCDTTDRRFIEGHSEWRTTCTGTLRGGCSLFRLTHWLFHNTLLSHVYSTSSVLCNILERENLVNETLFVRHDFSLGIPLFVSGGRFLEHGVTVSTFTR